MSTYHFTTTAKFIADGKFNALWLKNFYRIVDANNAGDKSFMLSGMSIEEFFTYDPSSAYIPAEDWVIKFFNGLKGNQYRGG